MAESDLDYAKTSGRFGQTVADTDDVGDNPDIVWCDEGTVELVPLIPVTKVPGGTPSPFEAGHSTYTATISGADYVDPTGSGFDGPGYLTYRGKPFVIVVDLTSTKVNPHVGPNAATHRVNFKNLRANGQRVDFPSRVVRLTKDGPNGDGVNDLALVLPVVVGEPTAIFMGPAGDEGPPGPMGDVTPAAQAAQQGAESAQAAAESSASTAAASESASATAASSAAASASSASTSAGAAATAQAATESAKTAAETASSTATTKASEAASSATAADGSATAAAGSASAASTSAGNASTSATAAETARTGAETARTGAEAAKTDAETAKADAEAAAAQAAAPTEGQLDALLPGKIADPADPVGSALSDSIAEQATPIAQTAAADYLATDPGVAASAASAATTAVNTYLGVPPDQLLSKSTNLFIKDTATEGKAYTAGSGALADSSTNGVSDYFPVTAGTAYVFAGPSRVTWFNASKVYISDNGGIASGSNRTAPAGAAYARVTLPIASFSTGQVNVGTVLGAYEVGYPTRVSDARAPAVANVSPDQTTFFNASTNLFDRRTVQYGRNILPGQGATSANSDYTVSDYIPVTSVTAYTYQGGPNRVTYYDAAKTYLGEFSFSAFPTAKTTPPRARYVRLSVLLANLRTAQMNLGSAALPYAEGGVKVRAERLPDTRRPVIDADIAGTFSLATPIPDMGTTISASTPQTVYDAYDAMVTAHPTYVTRTLLGNEASADALPIYRYDFKPGQPSNTSLIGNPTPKPKVILVSGTHGNERASVWSFVNLFDKLCNDWDSDPILAALRYNVHFMVNPVANPSGYRDNTRVNANGVDPARNWPTMWLQGDPATTTYGGTAPLSEPETLAMKTVLDAETDAALVLDFHNFHTPANNYDFLYGTPGTDRTAEVLSALIRRMDRKWKADEPTIVNQNPDTYIGYLSPVPNGSLGIEAAGRGYPLALTFEQCWKVFTQPGATNYNSLAMTWGLEAIVNFLTIALRNY